MTKKKQSRNLFEFLVQKPWWISMAGAVLFMMGFGALFPPEKKLLGIAAGLPFMIVGLIAAWRQWTGPSAAQLAAMQEEVLAMSWPEFSERLTQAFRSNGFDVKTYGGKGADFEIVKPGKHLLVACKRWKAATVGAEALRELQAEAEEKGLRAMYLTMGKISPAAFEYAIQERIDMVDADGISLLLVSAK